ncbi:hypothetical protein V5O48_015471 [Marasmius crinis-equi]|uniref:Uncharacterized protein n=1 Tax=Marasmius crinis-equi TaxID=585013 RepID=A0ABR3EUF8_9AGAR
MDANLTAEKLESWKEKLGRQAAAQASKRYRQRNQSEYNEKARLRMAKRRASMSGEAIARRNERARERYRENRGFVLGAQYSKRKDKSNEEHGREIRRQRQSRDIMPGMLFDLKDDGAPEYEVERLKWRSRVLGERQSQATGINRADQW